MVEKIPAATPAPPPVIEGFVSSLTYEHTALRRALFDLGQSLGKNLWVAEYSEPTLGSRPPLEIVDTLVARVRTARRFLCVLGGERHGTAVRFADHIASVSHLEVEIFQAALLGRPVELFIARGFAPGPRLTALLEILRFALPPRAWRAPLSDARIVAEITALLATPPRDEGDAFRAGRAMRQRLAHRLYWQRGRPAVAGGRSPAIFFLDRAWHEPRARPPDRQFVQSLLEIAAKNSDPEQRLTRYWIVIRELMGAPPDDARYAEYRPLWSQALGRWGGAAGWYGIHGHLFLGSLAALQADAHLRALMRAAGQKLADPFGTMHCDSAIASALVNAASLLPQARERRRLLRAALAEMSAPDPLQLDRPGWWNVRAGVHKCLGDYERAFADSRTSLALQERLGQWNTSVTLADLGELHLLCGRPHDAIAWLRDAIAMMQRADRQPSGFLVDAKLHLSRAYALTGRAEEAATERAEATACATRANLLGHVQALRASDPAACA